METRAPCHLSPRCLPTLRTQQTAKMNYRTQAKDGLPPNLFAGKPVYTGHYHMPHTVRGTSITYVGSPYQGENALGRTGRGDVLAPSSCQQPTMESMGRVEGQGR